jgi:flagellum-specific ATP synthase
MMDAGLDKLRALGRRARRLRDDNPVHVYGKVVHVAAGALRAAELSRFVALGDAVRIATGASATLGEVAAIDTETIVVTPLCGEAKIELGAKVTWSRCPISLAPHPSWKGRVLDPLGRPVDGLGPMERGERTRPVEHDPPAPLQRQRLGTAVRTGVKVIDFFTPLCAGQRIGIFAGSGVGKSTLLAMLARTRAFDTTVLALVGERGREVRDFLDDALGPDRARVIAVVATGDDSPGLRRLAPKAALTIAEDLRERGETVLLVIDSITRFAHAARELALAAGEPPVARGYPPSVFSALPRLLERAGPGEGGQGTITALVSVLVDGDDHNDPVADAVRGILDGHIVLDRRIAGEGRFPALDPLTSISRLAPKIRTADEHRIATEVMALVSRYEDTRDLRAIGGYRRGSDALLDRAVDVVPRLYALMRQGPDDTPCENVFEQVAQALAPTTPPPPLPRA